MVAELRAKTDAPMIECKKALTEANGDMVKAEELLRVKLGFTEAPSFARERFIMGEMRTCRRPGAAPSPGPGFCATQALRPVPAGTGPYAANREPCAFAVATCGQSPARASSAIRSSAARF
ncbi:hypothetical protein CCO03_15030 [Comamonas serinivorans]|uniref:Elongation factor Ts n=1 Tax=Comamonas serinivorans TaxID=1082851 RepID=A0A1Y0EQ89_9BURK|nr:hypothetical protein CCO03_15030 [Comamonas serinivorans]